MIQRAYKFRFYPTEEQKQILAKTLGGSRSVDHWALRLKTDAYYQENQRLYDKDLSARLTVLKHAKESVWLNEVSSVMLQQSLRHRDRSFLKFFEGRSGSPQFHQKRGKQAATYAASAFQWDGERLTLAKMSEPLAIRGSRHFAGAPSTVPTSKDAANRHVVALHVDEEMRIKEPLGTPVGID